MLTPWLGLVTVAKCRVSGDKTRRLETKGPETCQYACILDSTLRLVTLYTRNAINQTQGHRESGWRVAVCIHITVHAVMSRRPAAPRHWHWHCKTSPSLVRVDHPFQKEECRVSFLSMLRPLWPLGPWPAMLPLDMHVKSISPLISLLSCEGPIFINIGCRYIVSSITIIVSILPDCTDKEE